MINTEKLRTELGYCVCRGCINAYYSVNLKPKDCYYELYPRACSRCGEMSGIVTDFRAWGKVKLFFKRKK